MAAILENGGHIENNQKYYYVSIYNFKFTFYVHISILPNHLIWPSAVIFKVNDKF